jgi:DNA-binding PadR family transcriptional regulator
MTKTSFAILGVLSIEPMSGYAIRKLMQESTSNFWAESAGQLYPALADLAKRGYIVSKKAKDSGAREKKLYQLTNSGRIELKKWLAQEPETQVVRDEFMLKLFFGANIDPEVMLDHVNKKYYQIKAMLSNLIETKKELEKNYRDSLHFPYWKLSVDCGIKISEAKLEWLHEVISSLKKLESRK